MWNTCTVWYIKAFPRRSNLNPDSSQTSQMPYCAGCSKGFAFLRDSTCARCVKLDAKPSDLERISIQVCLLFFSIIWRSTIMPRFISRVCHNASVVAVYIPISQWNIVAAVKSDVMTRKVCTGNIWWFTSLYCNFYFRGLGASQGPGSAISNNGKWPFCF